MRAAVVELQRRVARDVAVLAARVLEHLLHGLERGEALGASRVRRLGGRRAAAAGQEQGGERRDASAAR